MAGTEGYLGSGSDVRLPPLPCSPRGGGLRSCGVLRRIQSASTSSPTPGGFCTFPFDWRCAWLYVSYHRGSVTSPANMRHNEFLDIGAPVVDSSADPDVRAAVTVLPLSLDCAR